MEGRTLWDRLVTDDGHHSYYSGGGSKVMLEEGDDWEAFSARLRDIVVESPQIRIFRHPWMYDQQYHLDGYLGSGMLELDFAWLWTPETTMAFSLFMVVLSLFLCCWISHKIGEFVCTTMAGILAMSLLFAVFLVFISQWW